MNKTISKVILLLITINYLISAANAQSGVPYANSWIQYGQPYVKIGVIKKGIHKLSFTSLPPSFPTSQPEKLQLWHRGKEIPILSLENNEIVFYAVPNDGASDSLLYRPASSRMNPYWSMYSDESAYFLTLGNSAGLRSERVDVPVDLSVPSTSTHQANSIVTFKDEYSLSISTYLRPSFLNSYFENGASKTGKVSLGGKAINLSFQLTDLDRLSEIAAEIKLMVHGRSPGSRNIEVYVGKNQESLRLVSTISNSGHSGSEYSFQLEKNDVDEVNKGIISLKSTNSSLEDGYSIAYYKISYPQYINMKGQSSKELQLMPSGKALTRLSLSNVDLESTVLDITDIDRPRIIPIRSESLMIPRISTNPLLLLVTTESVSVSKEKVTSVNFDVTYSPSANYMIVTSENLLASANKYAEYRASQSGGAHKVLVANVKDIYNQFNYGEPSPVAIRRFADYMLSKGVNDKYLFLIGKSITYVERMIRELPDEVPTVGLPGSDILLVDGLAGVPRDVPAIPVGRLSARSDQSVLDYLQKVKDYEQEISDGSGWKKNILHLNGGKTVSEITQLKNILSSLTPVVEDGLVGGKVKAFVKQQAIAETEPVNITPEVNSGVGLITYFGHGSTTVTDLDMGYISDAKKGYNNLNRYPLMYFNGCGVGNIFNGKFKGYPTTSDRDALSIDWLLAPKKGAIAIIANTLDSFVTPASKYLSSLYAHIFTNPNTSNLPIGDLQLAVVKKIVSENANSYDIANVHQSLLQGDPAVKLVSTAAPDYAIDMDQGIQIFSDSPGKSIANSGEININLYLQNLGKFIKGEKLQLEITYFSNNSKTVSSKVISSFAYHDTLLINIPNDRNFNRIEVKLDPFDTLEELTKNNNVAELDIDWEIAGKESIYPQGAIKDVIAPTLDVQFNGRNIRNDEKLSQDPVISVILKDDRFITPDTSKIDLYLKFCGDGTCDFERISYAGTDKIEVNRASNRSMKLTYSPSNILKPGIYELLVSGRDDGGNTSTMSYRIRFVITDESHTDVIASPNPAFSFVRFETSVAGIDLYDAIEWTVHSSTGAVVGSDKIELPSAGVNEWYWKFTSIPGGLYFYNVRFKKGNNVLKSLTGKVAVIR